MQITDMLSQIGALESMARELGVSKSQASSGAEALVPAILGGFKKQAQSQPEGLHGLESLLGRLGGGGLLDDVLAPEPTHADRGNGVLEQIFGSKDVSRTVAQSAAERSGVDPSVLKKMLPMLAMVVAGYMARQGTSGAQARGRPNIEGADGSSGSLFGDPAEAADDKSRGWASMLDLNGDGNTLDDILGMARKVMR
jgi:hypothetical protein